MNWFSNLFGKKEEPKSLSALLVESIQEVHAETRKHERELNDNAKLAKLFKKTILEMVKELDKGTNNFIHIHHFQVDLKEDVWATYARIFKGVAEELELPVELEKGYFRVYKTDVKKVFEKLRNSDVDVDERVRAMLSQGIYR